MTIKVVIIRIVGEFWPIESDFNRGKVLGATLHFVGYVNNGSG